MQQPGGQTYNGGAQILNGGPGTTGPPLATALNEGQKQHRFLIMNLKHKPI